MRAVLNPNRSNHSTVRSDPVNLAVQDHVLGLENAVWAYSELGQSLYRFFGIFNEVFFHGALTTPILSLEGARITNLGTYRLGRNGFGAQNHININSHHLNRPILEVLSTLLHEMIHQWQHEMTGNWGKPPYHNVAFRQKARALGIPSDAYGHQLAMGDPFLAVCQANGIEVDPTTIEPSEGRQRVAARGESKLKKWSCGCTNVRVAIPDFEAMCLKCGRKFARVWSGTKWKN